MTFAMLGTSRQPGGIHGSVPRIILLPFHMMQSSDTGSQVSFRNQGVSGLLSKRIISMIPKFRSVNS
eukprot:scaffold142018_cov20-Prasinocladus_malaysianus.AAC.1